MLFHTLILSVSAVIFQEGSYSPTKQTYDLFALRQTSKISKAQNRERMLLLGGLTRVRRAACTAAASKSSTSVTRQKFEAFSACQCEM